MEDNRNKAVDVPCAGYYGFKQLWSAICKIKDLCKVISYSENDDEVEDEIIW